MAGRVGYLLFQVANSRGFFVSARELSLIMRAEMFYTEISMSMSFLCNCKNFLHESTSCVNNVN
jgi:hypothetical protein